LKSLQKIPETIEKMSFWQRFQPLEASHGFGGRFRQSRLIVDHRYPKMNGLISPPWIHFCGRMPRMPAVPVGFAQCFQDFFGRHLRWLICGISWQQDDRTSQG
jgi:hypothetical protein